MMQEFIESAEKPRVLLETKQFYNIIKCQHQTYATFGGLMLLNDSKLLLHVHVLYQGENKFHYYITQL